MRERRKSKGGGAVKGGAEAEWEKVRAQGAEESTGEREEQGSSLIASKAAQKHQCHHFENFK